MPVAIVTGGASGIGLSITKHMVAKGWHVSIADVNETLGEQGAQALGDRVTFIRCDVTSWESQLNLFETTKKRFGRIDFVFANAGVADVPPLLNQPEDTVSKPNMRVIDICLTAAVYTIRLGLFYLRQNSGEGGRIVATASQMGIYPFPTGPLYGAAKAGVRLLPFPETHLCSTTRACVPGCTNSRVAYPDRPLYRCRCCKREYLRQLIVPGFNGDAYSWRSRKVF